MKIEKLFIESFGKFRNFEIDFKDGLNIVKRNNGFGKSTIIAFIKAMLYGFGDNKGQNARKWFMPWSGGGMSGRMQFEHDGKSYIVARTSGKAKRSDTCMIFDAATGQEVSLNLEEVIGIGQAGFEKTLFIRQMGLSDIKDGEEELTSRLLNLAQTGSEDESYDEAMVLLDKAKTTLLHKRGRGGRIAELEDEVSRLESEKYDISTAHDRLRAELADLSKTGQIRDRLKKEIDALVADREKAKKRTQARLLTEQLNQKKSAVEALEKDCMKKQKLEQRLADELEEMAQFKTESFVPPLASRAFHILQYALPTALLFAAAVIFILRLFLVGTMVAMVAIASFIGFFTYMRTLSSKRRRFLNSFGCETEEEYRSRLSDYKKAEQALYEQSVLRAAAYQNLEAAKKAYEEQKASLPDDPDLYEGEDSESLEKLIAVKERAYRQEGERLIAVQTSVGTVLAGKRTLDVVSAELCEAKEQLEKTHKMYQALCLATDTLEKVFSLAQQDFAPRLNEAVGEIFGQITNDTALPLVSQKMEVRLDGHEIEAYSAGVADQMYFALRMALVTLLVDKAAPIFLDDSFVQYDAARLELSMQYLAQLSKQRQVIYFTCHNQDRKWEELA